MSHGHKCARVAPTWSARRMMDATTHLLRRSRARPGEHSARSWLRWRRTSSALGATGVHFILALVTIGVVVVAGAGAAAAVEVRTSHTQRAS